MTETKKGVPLPETASLHEKAVQAVARGEVQPTPRKRRTPAQSPDNGPSTEVHTHIQLDQLVLSEVQRIIGDPENGYSRYEILDRETAIVR